MKAPEGRPQAGVDGAQGTCSGELEPPLPAASRPELKPPERPLPASPKVLPAHQGAQGHACAEKAPSVLHRVAREQPNHIDGTCSWDPPCCCPRCGHYIAAQELGTLGSLISLRESSVAHRNGIHFQGPGATTPWPQLRPCLGPLCRHMSSSQAPGLSATSLAPGHPRERPSGRMQGTGE